MERIVITPDLPYFAACFDCDFAVARRIAAGLGDDHVAAVDRAEKMAAAEAAEPEDLVLCESKDGWSLHAPGSTDEDIASGAAPYLTCGEGEPRRQDYQTARRALIALAGAE